MISKEEVHNLATLARLDLSEGEVVSLQTDISNILEYVGHLSAVSIGNGGEEINKTAVPLLRNVMRADEPREGSNILAGKEEKLKDAFPKREGDYNVVRKIIQKDE